MGNMNNYIEKDTLCFGSQYKLISKQPDINISVKQKNLQGYFAGHFIKKINPDDP